MTCYQWWMLMLITNQCLLTEKMMYSHWVSMAGVIVAVAVKVEDEDVLPCDCPSFLFLKRFCLFIYERHRKKGKDIDRGRSRLPVGAQCGTPSKDPRIRTWAKGRCLTTEPPRYPMNVGFKMGFNSLLLWDVSCLHFKVYCDPLLTEIMLPFLDFWDILNVTKLNIGKCFLNMCFLLSISLYTTGSPLH